MGLKRLGYYFFKYWVTVGLFFYYKKIRIVGLEHISDDKPVIFLSNHQNALLDILLIATKCNRKPWYLTRADVFKNSLFRPLFTFLQMLPIYRIRDGRSNLSKNQEVFEKCGALLVDKEVILLFPEANHSLKRNVRPLSKGFTRIIDKVLKLDPNIDLKLIPIGQNYQQPSVAGDSAALYFGEPISVQALRKEQDFRLKTKQAVFDGLTMLTTHINEIRYQEILQQLESSGADFTEPENVNTRMVQNDFSPNFNGKRNTGNGVSRFLFYMANLPMVFIWRTFLKPIVPEPEFEGTFRFGFVLLGYPFIYMLALVVLAYSYDIKTACLCILGHAVFNLILVKIGITSSHQRK